MPIYFVNFTFQMHIRCSNTDWHIFNDIWFLLPKRDEKDKIVDSENYFQIFTNLSFSQEWDFIFRQLWPYYVHNTHDNESFN